MTLGLLAGERYRRSPALTCYWSTGGLLCFNAKDGRHASITGDAVQFLAALDDWQTAAQLSAADPGLGDAEDVAVLLDAMATRGWVLKASGNDAEWPWGAWTPEAAFFHFATRNRRYPRSSFDYEMQLRRKAQANPPPPPTKSLQGARTALNASPVAKSLESALLSRRTWRNFGTQPLPERKLGTLLRLTFGVQQWRTVIGQGPVVLKTSPSGGARHSVEAYLIANNASGIDNGVYHYDAANHELVHVGRAVGRAKLGRVLGNQHYFMQAGAFVVMTAVVARAMWRYPFSRAYRTVLAEVGHLGQTFCLIATALNLAPFCTMAFRDSELESIIGVDGVNESALYVVGVGTRPRGRIAYPGKIPRRIRNGR